MIRNDGGRVTTEDGEPIPGEYAVGWIKRGPTGIIGTNKRDARETVDCLVEDLREDKLPSPPAPAREQFDALLEQRVRALVTETGWRAIKERPREACGTETRRPRVKLASREELLAATSK